MSGSPQLPRPSFRKGFTDVVEPAAHVCGAYQVAPLAVWLCVKLGASQVSAEFNEPFLALNCLGLAVADDALKLLDVIHGKLQ